MDVKLRENEGLSFRQDGQKLPKPLGRTVIKLALRRDPLGAASHFRVRLGRPAVPSDPNAGAKNPLASDS
jgi:hypothetical protein